MPRPRVTVVIPTNRCSPRGLAGWRRQDCDVEVLVLANGAVRPHGDRVLQVPWEGHGATRQRGVRESDRPYVLFTVDDAVPASDDAISRLVEALQDGGFDAVFGRQLPWPDTDVVTRGRLEAWTPPGDEVVEVARLDHVFALHQRQTLVDHPLPDVPIAEDLHWRQGRRIGYVPTACVFHAHPRRPLELYRRTRDIHRQHVALGESARVPSLAAVLRALPGVVGPVSRAGPRELPNQLAELLGQWVGGRGG